MKLKEETALKVNEIREELKLENNTIAVASCIESLYYIIKEMGKGNKLILRNENEMTERELKIKGVK